MIKYTLYFHVARNVVCVGGRGVFKKINKKYPTYQMSDTSSIPGAIFFIIFFFFVNNIKTKNIMYGNSQHICKKSFMYIKLQFCLFRIYVKEKFCASQFAIYYFLCTMFSMFYVRFSVSQFKQLLFSLNLIIRYLLSC